MTAAFVGATDAWPPSAAFSLELLEGDGDALIIVNADGSAELPILGADVDGKLLVIPVGFGSIDKARRAARTLKLAFEKVHAIEDEPLDAADDGHEHRFEEFRIGRAIAKQRICTLCGASADG